MEKETSSQDLLSCGSGAGLHDKLLLKPKAARCLQTEKVPRSSVLDRLHSFLPRMAAANQELKQQMEESPAGRFDIECVDEAERVIEMDVALVELSGTDSDSDGETSGSDGSSSEEGDEEESEITEENLKLPGDKNKKKKKEKANIQVLDQQGE